MGTAARRTPTAARTTARTASTRSASDRSATARPDLRLLPSAPVPPLRGRRTGSAASDRTRRAPFVLLVVALLVATTLGLLILNTAIAVDSLKATQLRAENAERAQEVQRLEQQVLSADAPAQLAAAAVAAGLVPAGPAAYLVIDGDGGSTLRGTPRPAADPDQADPDGD